MTLEDIKNSLKDIRVSKVSVATGLHQNTISKIRDGISKDPSHSTIEKLKAYLEGGKNGE